MRKLKAVLGAAVLAEGILYVNAAWGSISYSYVSGTIGSSGSSTQTTSYSVTLGSAVTIPIYFQETLTNGSTSLVNNEDGLISAGFSVTQVTSGTGTLTGIAGDTTTFPDPSSSYTSPSDTSQFLAYYQEASAAMQHAGVGPETNGAGQIEIGSITVTPASLGAVTYTLSNYSYPNPNGEYTVSFGSAYYLDPNNTTFSPFFTGASSNPETFTVTATPVPEPAGLGALGIGTIALALRRRSKN
jgi:hypothetical protein